MGLARHVVTVSGPIAKLAPTSPSVASGVQRPAVETSQGRLGAIESRARATRVSWTERKRANPDKHFAVSGFCAADHTRDLEAVGFTVYEAATPPIATLAGFAWSFREWRRGRPSRRPWTSPPTPVLRPFPPATPGPPAKRRMRPRNSASRLCLECSRRTSSTRAVSGAFA